MNVSLKITSPCRSYNLTLFFIIDDPERLPLYPGSIYNQANLVNKQENQDTKKSVENKSSAKPKIKKKHVNHV